MREKSNIACMMLNVRAKRKRVDELLDKLAGSLDLKPHIKERLFSDGAFAANLRDHLKVLSYAIAELADAERKVKEEAFAQAKYESICTDGRTP